MDFGLETSIFLAYTVGLLLLYFLGRVFFVPLKAIFRLLINSLIGGLVLIVVRVTGMYLGIILPVNPLNSVIVGITGLPGVIGLLIYFNLLQ